MARIVSRHVQLSKPPFIFQFPDGTFLGSMLPQYMALSVSSVTLRYVCQKKNLKCNISLTEAHIFMKFETYVYKIVLDHQPNFYKDPCKDACTQGKNARTCDALQRFRSETTKIKKMCFSVIF